MPTITLPTCSFLLNLISIHASRRPCLTRDRKFDRIWNIIWGLKCPPLRRSTGNLTKDSKPVYSLLFHIKFHLAQCIVSSVEPAGPENSHVKVYMCSAVAEMDDRLATIDMSGKWGAVPLLGGARSPSSTIWPGPRPTFVPSGTLIHPAVRP